MNPEVLATSSTQFLKRFCWVALLSSLVILVLAGYAAFKLYERYVVSLAESNAVNIAASMASVHETPLLTALKSPPLLPPQVESLDQLLKAFLEPYGIVKVKLFALDAKIIYSTDMNLIGKVSTDNRHLETALAGGNSSVIQTKDQIRDLAHADRFDVDVVESYVAMKGPQGDVVGVFEIYQDMTAFRQEVNNGVFYFVTGLALILLLVFSAAFSFMCRAATTMISQQRRLEQLATVDMVTGVYNRAEITRIMEAEWERYSRSGEAEQSFGLLMLDLDHFKAVNDQHGHLVGDELLKQVAQRLLSELRAYSDVGRYGGEEFIVLIPQITLADIQKVADRVLQLLSENSYQIEGQALSITASIGFAVAHRDDTDLDAVIKRADDCLYDAKDAGRNCVIGAD